MPSSQARVRCACVRAAGGGGAGAHLQAPADCPSLAAEIASRRDGPSVRTARPHTGTGTAGGPGDPRSPPHEVGTGAFAATRRVDERRRRPLSPPWNILASFQLELAVAQWSLLGGGHLEETAFKRVDALPADVRPAKPGRRPTPWGSRRGLRSGVGTTSSCAGDVGASPDVTGYPPATATRGLTSPLAAPARTTTPPFGGASAPRGRKQRANGGPRDIDGGARDIQGGAHAPSDRRRSIHGGAHDIDGGAHAIAPACGCVAVRSADQGPEL